MKILEARHGKESAWISINLKPSLNNFDNVVVSFKPIKKYDAVNRLRIFARRFKKSPKIEVSIQNIGDLKIELKMETFCWDKNIDDVQSIGKTKLNLEPDQTGPLAFFRLDNMEFNCGGFKNGIDFRIHFKPDLLH